MPPLLADLCTLPSHLWCSLVDPSIRSEATVTWSLLLVFQAQTCRRKLTGKEASVWVPKRAKMWATTKQCKLLSLEETRVWDKHQTELLSQLKSGSVDICGDGRCDSPGHSAKYLTYSFLCASLGKILHSEQIQVGEPAQTLKKGLIRGLQFLQSSGIAVKSLTTDRRSGIKKHIREKEPEILHYFDVWHVSKVTVMFIKSNLIITKIQSGNQRGLRKKLNAASKRAGCMMISKWTPAIVNHLHWCASATKGNGAVVAAAWQSMLNNLLGIHEGHSDLYQRCLHRPLHLEWLTAGKGQIFFRNQNKQIKSIVTAPLLVTDIRQLSPDAQTYALKSFHSVLNNFAPKSTAFTYGGMKAQTLIAALHFNENTSRKQAETTSGDPMWRNTYLTSCHAHALEVGKTEGLPEASDAV
ncbi:uncharacterized protein LOC144139893 [Haemaphysalis longicornis]